MGHQHRAEPEHGERRDQAHCRDGGGGLADVGCPERSGGDRPVDEAQSRGDDRRRHQSGGTAQQEAQLAPMLGLRAGAVALVAGGAGAVALVAGGVGAWPWSPEVSALVIRWPEPLGRPRRRRTSAQSVPPRS